MNFVLLHLHVKRRTYHMQRIQKYIEEEIIPRYRQFDKAHQEDHVRTVIQASMALAEHYPVSPKMVYVIAAFHDTGLAVDRKSHHLESGRIVREDSTLPSFFTPEEIETMAQAVEDHRASNQQDPRSIYGKIVAEADRIIDAETICRRTVQFGLNHYPELPREAQIQRALDHLHEKYARGGYLKLHIPESPNAAALAALQDMIDDDQRITAFLEQIFDREVENDLSR